MSTTLAGRRTSTLLTRTTVAVVAVVALAMPMLMSDVTFFMQMVLAAIVVTGLSLLMGYAGQASLGQGAFFAVGALTVGIGTTTWALPPLLALVLAPVLASAFAAVVGIPLLRLRGHYLAFGTLALLLMVVAAMSTFDSLGGSLGIAGIPPLAVGSLELTDPRDYAYLALGCLALVLVISRNLISSRFGRGIQALAGSETAAASAGVAVFKAKLSVFAISAAFAGLAGALSAFFTPFISPESFPASRSFEYVIMAVVGGLGALWGGVLGAVAMSVVIEVLNRISTQPGLPATAGPILQYAAYTVLLILALLWMPRGLISLLHDTRRRLSAMLTRAPQSR
jgi:branched-chain amino acid transport system permease protein